MTPTASTTSTMAPALRPLIVCLLLAAFPCLAADIAGILGKVSVSQYQTYQVAIESMGLGLYGGPSYNQGVRNRDGTSGPGSLGNQEARLYLVDTFTDMGLDVSVQGDYRNVIGELPGVTAPQNIFIICGHYDHLGGDAPGGDDNASGTAGVLEAARILSQYRFDATLRFIGFNAEEDGLLGSKNYVNNVVVPNGENILGVINLDMILRPGWDSDPNAIIDLDCGTRNIPACIAWSNAFKTAAQTYVPSLLLDPVWPYTDSFWGNSDHEPFANAGFAAIGLMENKAIELWWGGNTGFTKSNVYYHTSNDASDRLANDPGSPSGVLYDYEFATNVMRATVATILMNAGLYAIPEPGTFALLALALAALPLRRHDRSRLPPAA